MVCVGRGGRARRAGRVFSLRNRLHPLTDLLNGRLKADALLCEAHLIRERRLRAPLAALPRGGLFQQAVDLLERQALHLRHEEERKRDTDAAQGAPKEEDFSPQVSVSGLGADEVRGDDADDAIPEPVGSGGETDTAGADGQGEDFTDNDPGRGAPGHGEHGNVDADEGDHGGDGG